ncbi:Scr1 family TA system antitoxin-like transcriptional regulator [Actinopolyspora alba]|uniref:Scr1 family TA system antitoxin-like transcriptional regulator n=1 Tax=Actinopolyspora alba TaxID=673379 RepID=UPI00111341CC|nr:Scr1 family TA system antitoxin-like transcriptional regulator [Actinopolyspora alba]
MTQERHVTLDQFRKAAIEVSALGFPTGDGEDLRGGGARGFPPELENDPGTVYVDTRVKGYYYQQPEEIAVYRAAMRRLQAQACQSEETPVLISRITKEL